MSEEKVVSENIIILRRSVEAVLIPSAARLSLSEGTEVAVTQALGGSYTVSVYGNLARIDGRDADALGFDKTPPVENLPSEGTIEDRVWTQLKTCYDPEIPVNIVDLGLIYDCVITKKESDQHDVWIKMTLTAPGCAMGPVIVADAKERVLALPDIEHVDIDIVFDPPWDQNMMSDEAKLSLGML